MSDSKGEASLEELGSEEQVRRSEELLSLTCAANARRGLQHALTPGMLLDPGLTIIWVNPAFQDRFGGHSLLEAQNLCLFFSESLDEQGRAELFHRLNSPETGYCWYGRLEKRIKDQLSVVANLVVLPLFCAEQRPAAYQGVFSDISEEYRQMLKTTYQSLLEAARLKDNDTGNHIERVNRYSRTLAESLLEDAEYPEVDVEFVEDIGFLAAMHDVGKIGTPDDILNKAGKLEPWEWEIMKEHTINGAYIMANHPNPMARDIALRHHERWDGSGYPHGVEGTLIPLSARIVAIADVYDALRMSRAYKDPLTHERARASILELKGRQFEPSLADRFEALEGSFREIFESLREQQD